MATSPQIPYNPETAYIPKGFPVVKLSNNKAQMDTNLTIQTTEKNPRGYREKLFLNITTYDKTPHVYLSHAIDGPVFRMLSEIILTNQWKEAIQEEWFGSKPICQVIDNPKNPQNHYYQWTEYKGSPNKAGAIISRPMILAFNDLPGYKYPWTITLNEGPGRENATKAVMPAGPSTKKVQMQLSPVQMHHWMLLGTEALQALTTAQMLRSPLLS